ncbi:MAG: hypothetical protein B7Z44_00790 [Caulobacter sp. 12-67-6]|nr:MAG: hypothetical protein B7Z44_00790 [Caulobacter sp. 12-67-6]OYX67167.1 MAG: hypothetical protein B7Y81_19365 [Caulobacter sp. 32-67-35]OYX97587.1 MAG: hypothetical protein B7Y78_01850 [Caulobacter sp. 35-67-4]OZA74492.1 MAG: hypothetical protein B7X77_08425 [Caulobacter sp. 39-67-4]
MSEFPVVYDLESNVVRIDGAGGATVLLNMVHAAKFGAPLNPDLIFNPGVAALLTGLKAASLRPEPLWATPFTQADIVAFAGLVLEKAGELGWWHMDHTEQVSLLQNVVAAPHRFSSAQIEMIQAEAIGQLNRMRDIIEAVPPLSEEDREWLEANLTDDNW